MEPGNLGGVSSVRIKRLSDSNLHTWKQEIDLFLIYGEVQDIVAQDNPFKNGTPEYTSWVQQDKQTRPLIFFSVSGEMLEHVPGVTAAQQMLGNMYNVFQGHNLLKKLRARCKFYTVEMKGREREHSTIHQWGAGYRTCLKIDSSGH